MNKTGNLLFGCLFAFCAASPALAQLSVYIGVGVPLPPPAPMVEVVPVPPYGTVWAPGYWAWHHDRYIWIRGRHVVARPGHAWQHERWERRGDRWHFINGHWARDRHPQGRGHPRRHGHRH